MRSLQTFEPPKNGEKILTTGISSKTLLVLLIIGVPAVFGITSLLRKIFNYNDTTDNIVAVVVITVLVILFLFFYVRSKYVFDIYYLDDYLILDDYKISYKCLDNFLYDDFDKGIRISFIPTIPEDIKNDIPNLFLHKLKTKKPHWMRVNSKYKKVRIELVNYLNEKIKNYR
jgi:hypothetical protein